MLLFGASVAVATHGGDSDELTGCLDSDGHLTNVAVGDDPEDDCERGQTEISWNRRGPSGSRGGEGPRGLRGPAGADGADGPPGLLDRVALCALEARISEASDGFATSEECEPKALSIGETELVAGGARRSVLAAPGLRWQTRTAASLPTESAPSAPNNVFSDPGSYRPGTEVSDPGVTRPIYQAGLQNARWLRYMADRYLAGEELARTVAQERIDDWSRMDPVRSTSATPGLATGLQVMSGVFFAAADLGIRPAGAEAWITEMKRLLSDRDWNSGHNFRSSAITTLAAALSANSPSEVAPADVALVKELLDDHVSRTFYGEDRNSREDERARGLHYPLLEINSIALVSSWLAGQGSALDDAAADELSTFLVHAWPRFAECARLNPVPDGEPCTYATLDGEIHTDIGPIDANLWGSTMEWMIRLDFAPEGARVPAGFRGNDSPYHAFARTPI